MSARRAARRDALHAVGAAAGALVITVALVAFLGRDGGRSGAGGSSPTSTTRAAGAAAVARAEALDRRVDEAFQPVVDALPRLLQAVGAHADGAAGPDDVRREATTALRAFTVARDRVAEIGTFAPRPAVTELYLASARLYIESVRVLLVAIEASPGAWYEQAERTSRRIRILGDRVYDRARALLDPELGDPYAGGSGVDVQRAEEVPDWGAEGLAAGPPLDEPPPPPAASPPARVTSRPQQPVVAWVRAVARAGVPDAEAVAGAVERGDPAQLRDLARRALAATERLRDEADPRGRREDGARCRIAILLIAEVARTAQLAATPGAPSAASRLDVVARRVALVADDVWRTVPALDARSTGFDRSLLGQDAP